METNSIGTAMMVAPKTGTRNEDQSLPLLHDFRHLNDLDEIKISIMLEQ